MIDINDYTSCWVCENIVDHQEQIGLLHLDFPRCFILIPDNTSFQMECTDDFNKEYRKINWLDPSEEISEGEKRAVLDRLWNFLATQERKEEDLAADREIENFLYGDAF